MRTVTYSAAISLDGFLAGPGETIDWIRHSDEAAKMMVETFRDVDTMLMGRKTFEFAQRMGGAPPMRGVKTYVFSRTLLALPEGADGELVTTDATEFVRCLKAEPGGKIFVMGGGELASALIDAGLVDEISFSIQPILLGAGIPAFHPMRRRIVLEFQKARCIGSGCVVVRYLPEN